MRIHRYLPAQQVLGYILTNSTRVTVTRDKLAFDPQLYPFVISKTKEPALQTFHKLTTPAVTSDKPAQTTVDKDDEPDSDFDPDADRGTTKSLATRKKALSDVQKSIIPSDDASTQAAATAPDTTEATIPDKSSSESDTQEPGTSRTLRTRLPKATIKTTITNPSASTSKRLLHAIPSIQTTNTNVTRCCKLRLLATFWAMAHSKAKSRSTALLPILTPSSMTTTTPRSNHTKTSRV